jgi:hypothetical protein
LALFKRTDFEITKTSEPASEIAYRGTPSEYDLMMECQRAARKMLLLLDFDGPVVRGEPQRRQLLMELAALVEHYASLRYAP